jgi:hypothetical protein
MTRGVTEPAPRRARALLEAARWALYEDLQAAGADEERQQPRLRARARLLARIDRFLGQR